MEGCQHPAADIIIPVHNQFQRTRSLLEGIYRHSDHPFHIHLIDNCSSDETVDLPKIYARDISVVHNRENRGWCRAVNQGIEMSNNPYLVFMSGDVEVARGWLGNLVAFLETHSRIGAVGPLLSNGDDWQSIDRVREKMVPQLPEFLTDDLHERNRILSYHFHRTGILVDGALAFCCIALKRRAVDEAGLLDEACRGEGHPHEEDYCRRLRKAGYVLGLSLGTCINCDPQAAPCAPSIRSAAASRQVR